VSVEVDYDSGSLKSALKAASREGARFVVIVGDNELSSRVAVVRNMTAGLQQQVAFDDLLPYLKER